MTFGAIRQGFDFKRILEERLMVTTSSHATKRSRRALAALAILSYGTSFSACETRFKEAFVDGSTNLLFSLLSPENFLPDDEAGNVTP